MRRYWNIALGVSLLALSILALSFFKSLLILKEEERSIQAMMPLLSPLDKMCSHRYVSSGIALVSKVDVALYLHYRGVTDVSQFLNEHFFSGNYNEPGAGEQRGNVFRENGLARQYIETARSEKWPFGDIFVATLEGEESSDINLLKTCIEAIDSGDQFAGRSIYSFLFPLTDEYEQSHHKKSTNPYDKLYKQYTVAGELSKSGLSFANYDNEAVGYLERSAEMGDIVSSIWIADRYSNGSGVLKDRSVALKYYISAAATGDIYALWRSAEILMLIDPDHARPMLEIAASKGSCPAAYTLSKSYYKEDIDEAYFWHLVGDWLGQKIDPKFAYSISQLYSEDIKCKMSFIGENSIPERRRIEIEAAAGAWARSLGALHSQFDGDTSPERPNQTPNDSYEELSGNLSMPMWKWHEGEICNVRIREAAVSAEEVYEIAKDAVWSVIAKSGAVGKSGMQGSAIAISDNELLTNCHVVSGFKDIKISTGDVSKRAFVLSSDIDSDRCILGVSEPNTHYLSRMRKGTDIKVGERFYAIGTPRGLELTLSEGVVSSIRSERGGHYVQTTAHINPGSSGGALLDESGSLVGVTTFQIRNSAGLNFAILAEDYCR